MVELKSSELRALVQIAAVVFSAVPAVVQAIPTCPEPPYDFVECTMPGGCPGVSYCMGRGTWSACTCAASGGEQVSCAGTTTTNGCSVKYAGTGTCSSSCTNDCEQNKVWVKTTAHFTGSGAGGYGAFANAECGSKEAGTCPFKDPSNLANYGQQTQWKDVTSFTKNTGSGCADNDANCRFAANSTQPEATVKVKGADDHVGPRNELAAFREECGGKTNAEEGDIRWYTFELLVPSTEFPGPGTVLSGPGQDPGGPFGTIFMQFMHDQTPSTLYQPCPGPYSFLAIRRTDTSNGQQTGSDWQFVFGDRGGANGVGGGIIDGATTAPWITAFQRHWASGAFTRDVWHSFLVKKVWSATNGETHVWFNGSKVVTLTGQKSLPKYPTNSSHACYNATYAGQTQGVFLKMGQYSNPNQELRSALKFRDVAVAPTCSEACPKCLATVCQ